MSKNRRSDARNPSASGTAYDDVALPTTDKSALFASLIHKMTAKNFDEDVFAPPPKPKSPTPNTAAGEISLQSPLPVGGVSVSKDTSQTPAPLGGTAAAQPKTDTKIAAPVVKQQPSISVRRTTAQNAQASSEASMAQIFGTSIDVEHKATVDLSDVKRSAAGAEGKTLVSSTVSTSEPATSVSAAQQQPLSEWLHPKLLRTVSERLKIERLTRVQQLAWEPMCEPHRDVLIRSETGSGKTFAYAGPLLHTLLTECDVTKIDRSCGTLIIVLAPTRELVEQVAQVAQTMLQNAQFVTVGLIHGGDNRHKEKARLRKGLHVLVATPGRLLDHLKTTEAFDHKNLQTIVLDEADRLLDMGFERAVREIMEIIKPRKRVLVSATITDAVERLSHFTLKDPIRVGETEDTFQVPASLRQHVSLVPAKHRLSTLASFLRAQMDAGSKKIVVFMSTSDSVEFHYLLLSRLQSPYSSRKRTYTVNRADAIQRPRRKGFKKMTEAANRHLEDDGTAEDVVTFEEDDDDAHDEEAAALEVKDSFLAVNIFKLHGNMGQIDRASVFHNFKHSTEQGILFCTDVAARGLDMPHIDWIVHYDPPTDERCYIHRVGRTARIGRVGDSMLFLMPHEAKYAEYLSKFIAMPIEEKKHEVLLYYLTKLDPGSHHSWMQSTATLERKIAHTIRSDSEGLSKVNLFAYQSYIRAYSGYPRQVRQFFNADELHLGHIAHCFGIDEKPSELRKTLRTLVRDERKIGRDRSRFRRGEKMEIDTKETYHSTIVNKTMKHSRDYHEFKKETTPFVARPGTFTEFDA